MIIEIIKTSFWHFFWFCFFLTIAFCYLITAYESTLNFIVLLIRGHKKEGDTINNYSNGVESGEEK
jgi:hypothetical protein